MSATSILRRFTSTSLSLWESSPLSALSLVRCASTATGQQSGGYRRPSIFRPAGSCGTIEGNEELTLKSTVVDVHQTVKVTKGGKVRKFSVLVLTGNGNGVAGYGLGKGEDVPSAKQKAEQQARRSLRAIKLDGCTLPYDMREKFGQTDVLLRAANPGAGIRTNPVLRAVLQSFGYKDAVGKCFGSRNKLNQVKAAFNAITQADTVEEVALRRGQKVVEVN
uniref:S5 DRBM domain-containing protein n=1 Tax=Palpitomonas bilix TaxID=652834 RepID=A0A7S3DK24_9EUKA|mmetsp:Transcript_41508/g.107504  ORF Transcript_41508/g.107504 Transcript_41508/m.107504 type:complete len:221 (+) Transcript_41508:118-780(+)|eukprot:CAMPEP_0113868994 /NCGR_PEP_ID=MMETSP0780_2-20120614/1293_1 /TAXON_ID=652834 /ORGANISM="Palpitomonas bilix" /LENGTH=220 /DNA_ID=CAMNT_0000854129 /DNA_START=119 /DNA_END=781 /DNA_ORIENTATION=+ /assembly_acc=CAM_ASM_000599